MQMGSCCNHPRLGRELPQCVREPLRLALPRVPVQKQRQLSAVEREVAAYGRNGLRYHSGVRLSTTADESPDRELVEHPLDRRLTRRDHRQTRVSVLEYLVGSAQDVVEPLHRVRHETDVSVAHYLL